MEVFLDSSVLTGVASWWLLLKPEDAGARSPSCRGKPVMSHPVCSIQPHWHGGVGGPGVLRPFISKLFGGLSNCGASAPWRTGGWLCSRSGRSV